MMNITVIGAGAFGTAIANVLSSNENLTVSLLSKNTTVVDSINKLQLNCKYFPYLKLNPTLKATTDINVVKKADIIFFAIPSWGVEEFVQSNYNLIDDKSKLIVNLSKGYNRAGKTVGEFLSSVFEKSTVYSMKGPTFADEVIRHFPSGFTVSSKEEDASLLKEIFDGTNIVFDYFEDLKSIELASVFKNVYAIVLGFVDAKVNSANTRFLVFTKVFREMKDLLKLYGVREDVLYKYCGIGDLALTGLNDLSRNRTMGLMLGKGFLNLKFSHSVVLEGVRVIKYLFRDIERKGMLEEFSIVNSLYKYLRGEVSDDAFLSVLIR